MSTRNTTSVVYCSRNCPKPMRYDHDRMRLVCDNCEAKLARTQRPVRSSIKPKTPTKAPAPLEPRLPGLLSLPLETKASPKPVTQKTPLRLVPMPDAESANEESDELLQRQSTVQSRGPAIQTKMPLQGGKAQNQMELREVDVQNGTINALFHRGYHVFENTVHLKSILVSCKNCGEQWWQRPKYATGQTPGIPDLDCVSQRWNHPLLPAALWLGLEQKGTTGRVRPEQKALHDAGLIVVSRSVENNIDAAQRTDQFFEYVGELEKLREAVALNQNTAAILARLEQMHPQNIATPPKPPKKIT